LKLDIAHSALLVMDFQTPALKRQHRSANSGSGAKARISIEWPARLAYR
jgi:hypothetical protein